MWPKKYCKLLTEKGLETLQLASIVTCANKLFSLFGISDFQKYFYKLKTHVYIVLYTYITSRRNE